MDWLILIIAVVSFILFLVIHVGTFRYTSRQNVLSALRNICLLSWAVGAMFLVGVVGFNIFLDGSWLKIAFFETFIYGLLCFLYVLYVFGPFESSIRFRLIFELYQNHPQGMSREDIEKKYNSDIFLRRRLDRLLASGDLVLAGDVYQLRRRQNIFMLLDIVSERLQKVISKRF